MRLPRITPLMAASVFVLSTLGLAGCGGGIGTSVGPGGNTVSQVRSYNALQGCTGNVDIAQLNVSPPTASNLPYNFVPAGYKTIRAGTGLHYGIFPTGQTSNPVALADINLGPHDPSGNPNSGTYTLVAAGICGGGSGITTPHLIRLQDEFPNNFTGTAAGTVGLRLINLVPDLVGGMTLDSNGFPLHGTDDAGTNNVPYAATSGYETMHYNAGLNLTGSPTLTVRTNANTVIGTVQNFTFQPGHAYTLFVIGEIAPGAGAHPINIVPVQDF